MPSEHTVSVTQLAAEPANGTAPTLLDVRWNLSGPPGLAEYRRGHLPGARFVDLDSELAALPGPAGRHPLPGTGAFESAMRRAGVDDDAPVVVYDAGGGLSAARLWWLLRYHGHTAVRLLDGGVAAWLEAGHPLSTEDPAPATGTFHARPGAMPLLTADEVLDFSRRHLLLDARAVERYRGEVEPIDPVAGHIPGARSAPSAGNLGPDGRFLSPAALRARFAEAGAVSGVSIGSYCGSGVTAAHEVLALALAGLPAALYPGSWSEWVSDPSRPVAVGADPGAS